MAMETTTTIVRRLLVAAATVLRHRAMEVLTGIGRLRAEVLAVLVLEDHARMETDPEVLVLEDHVRMETVPAALVLAAPTAAGAAVPNIAATAETGAKGLKTDSLVAVPAATAVVPDARP